MPPKKRLLILAIFAVLFGLSAAALVAYSRGFRLDTKRLRLIQTGAIYLITTPDNAKVILNGTEQKRAKISLQNGLLIDRLTPKTFELEITKQDYQTWYQQIDVRSGMVSTFRNVVLFPLTISKRRLDNHYRNQIIFNQSQMVYLIEETPHKISLKIRNNQNNEAVAMPLEKLTDLQLLQTSVKKRFFLIQQGKVNPRWIVFDATLERILEISQLFKQANFAQAQFNPQKEEELIIEASDKLQVLNVITRKTRILWPKKIQGFSLLGNNIHLLDNASSALITITTEGKTQQTIAQLNKHIRSNESRFIIKPLSADQSLLWSESDNLLFLNRLDRNQLVRLIDTNILEAIPDPTNKKIAYVKKTKTGTEMWIFYLEDDDSTGQAIKAGSKVFLTNSADTISYLNWYKNKSLTTHLLYLETNQLKTADIDNRSRINSFILATSVVKYHYEQDPKLLHWIDPDNIWRAELKVGD